MAALAPFLAALVLLGAASPASAVTPTLTIAASGTGTVGAPMNATGTLAGGVNPTGTLTFRLYSDAACTQQVATSMKTVSGNGAYTSDPAARPLRAPTAGPSPTAATSTTSPWPRRAQTPLGPS